MRARHGLLSLVSALIVVALNAAPASAAPLPECGSVNEDGSTSRGTLKLELVNGKTPSPAGPSISFEDKRDQRRLLLEFRLEGCDFPATATGKDLVIESIDGSSADGVDLKAQVSSPNRIKARDVLAVSFVIDPSDDDTSPGSYSTGLVVTDPSMNLVRQPVEVTFQYQHKVLLLLLCLLPIYFIGTFLVYYKGRAAGSTEKYLGWLLKPGNLFASFAGLSAAFFYIDTTTLADAGFGRDLFDNPVPLWLFQSDFLKTVFGAGSAFTAAALGSSLLGDRIRGGTAPQTGEQAGSFAAN